jgi:hypothetical protein
MSGLGPFLKSRSRRSQGIDNPLLLRASQFQASAPRIAQ